MLLLITENHRAGLSLASEAFSEAEISSKDVIGLDQALAKVWATDVNPDFLCEARAFLSSVALVLTVAVGGKKGNLLYNCPNPYIYMKD